MLQHQLTLNECEAHQRGRGGEERTLVGTHVGEIRASGECAICSMETQSARMQ